MIGFLLSLYYKFTVKSVGEKNCENRSAFGKVRRKKCSGTFFPDTVQIFLLPEMVNKDERYDVKTVDLNVLQEGTLIEQNAPFYH